MPQGTGFSAQVVPIKRHGWLTSRIHFGKFPIVLERVERLPWVLLVFVLQWEDRHFPTSSPTSYILFTLIVP
jgi:hypothetical protein